MLIIRYWPDGEVPYNFDASFSPENEQKVENCCRYIESKCGVEFERKNAADMLVISDETGLVHI